MTKKINFRTLVCALLLLVGSALRAQDSKTTLVTPPDGADISSYVMTAVAYGEDAIRQNLNVIIIGSDVYMQGISKYVPEGWVHGTISGGEIVFDTPQLLGNYQGNPHYFLGANTQTGDVSDLRMIYDSATKSFTSYENLWILLTPDYTQVGYFYNDLLNTVSILPASIAGDDPSVVPPAGLQTKPYEMRGYIEDSRIQTYANVEVGRDGDDFYIKGLYPGFPNAWAKGTLEADGQVHFPEMQYLGNYHGLYDLNLTGVTEEGFTPFVLEYNAAKDILVTPVGARYVINCGDEQFMPMMNLYDLTIKAYTPVQPDMTGMYELPSGVNSSRYLMNAREVDTQDEISQNVHVAFAGDKVYIRGLAADFSDTWMVGTLDDNVVTFRKNQLFGIYMDEYPIWLAGGDSYSGELLLGDFVLLYDKAQDTFTQPEFNYMVANASSNTIYHYQMLQNVTLTAIDKPQGIESLTEGAASSTVYSLDGKRHDNARALKPGIYVRDGKKFIVK